MDNDIRGYKINRDKILGKGTYSRVYVGTQGIRNVAIKEFMNDVDVDIVSMFANEVCIMRKMNHKNIVRIIDDVMIRGKYYIVMEYCDSHTLHEYNENNIEKEIYPLEMEVKMIYRQIKEGMLYIYDMGFMHRDIKPSNILMNRLGHNRYTVKICDFGYTRMMTDITDRTTACGTPLYASPELLLNNKYNVKVDIWSFGVMLYETLMNEIPYKANSVAELKEMFIQDGTIIISRNISYNCENLIRQSMQKEHTTRIGWNELRSHRWFI